MSTTVQDPATGHRWGTPGTGWETLTGEQQRQLVESGVRHWHDIHDRVPTYNDRWRPLRPIIMTGAQWSALHQLSDRVAELILQACRRRAGTAGELRVALGVAEGHIKLLDEAEPLGAELLLSSRPDIIFAGGVPKFVEFNIDGALGGAFDSDNLAAGFAAGYAADGLDTAIGIRPAPSAVDGRFATIAEWLAGADPDDRAVAMVMDWNVGHAGPVDPREFLHYLAPVVERARLAGFELIPYWLHWLAADDERRLLVDGRPIRNVFRMFVPDTPPPSDGLTAVEQLVRGGRVRCFTSAATWLLTNKLVLAWLWQDLPGLEPADRELIAAHIPRTALVIPELVADAVARQRELVLKPNDGSSGRDVTIGREESSQGWQVALGRAVDAGGFLLQELVDSDPLPMHFLDIHTGAVVEQGVPCCFGPYLFGHRQCGGEVRMGFPGGGTIMNVDRGALVDGFALVDG
jgi:hypothetical protein